MKKAIALGDRVKCIVTGLKGIAICKTEYLNGCVRFGVQPEGTNKDGKTYDAEWVDEQQLEHVATTPASKIVKQRQLSTGGPGPVPKRERNAPTR